MKLISYSTVETKRCDEQEVNSDCAVLNLPLSRILQLPLVSGASTNLSTSSTSVKPECWVREHMLRSLFSRIMRSEVKLQ